MLHGGLGGKAICEKISVICVFCGFLKKHLSSFEIIFVL